MINIDHVLEKYISRDQVDHAIMITGAWGSGKTHYWNHSIVPIIEANNLKPIYLSLYGVSSIADLESNLFWHMALSSLDPKKHKWVKGGAMIAKGILGVVSTITTGGGRASVDLDPGAMFTDIDLKASIVGEMQKYVVCFDDLERCKIPTSELLGFINHYVEHQGMKTLIIAHESEVGHLSPDVGEEVSIGSLTKEFDKVKEKVIGRILTYSPDIAAVCPQLIQIYEASDPDFFGFMQTHSDEFVRQLVKFKVDNFRSIRFILDNLREQFNALEDKGLMNKGFQKLLLFNCIVALEYKKGTLTSKDLNDPHNLKDLYQLYRMMSYKIAKSQIYEQDQQVEETPPELKFIERIVKEYFKNENEPINDLVGEFMFVRSVYHHILSGVLNGGEFRKELIPLLPENVPPHVTAFRRLVTGSFRELKDSEFLNLEKEVWNYSKIGTYVIHDYAQIAIFYKHFIDNGLIKRTRPELESMIQKGISLSIILGNTPLESSSQTETMLLFSTGDEYVDRVVKPWIKEAHQKNTDKSVAMDAVEFLRLLEAADREQLAKFMEARKHIPFLQQLPAVRVRQSLRKSSNPMLRLLIAHIQHRYGSSLIDYLTPERTILQVMLDHFRKEDGRLGRKPLTKFNVTELIKSLEEAIAAIDKASPKAI